MLDQKTREKIALTRFSLISPVINGAVENQKQYFAEITDKPITMPYYGERIYSPATLKRWLSDYRRFGFDALKPGFRSDRGTFRKMTLAVEEAIQKQLAETPRMKTSVLYERLLEEGIILPGDISRATFYRYFAQNPEIIEAARSSVDHTGLKERRRFSYANVNDLWQSDVLFGPFIRQGRKRRQAYLIAFLDDTSRLPTFSAFYFEQNFLALRETLKEAVLRRGKPKMIYTDNGKIYRSQQFALICANLGTSLIFAKPFEPQGRGKIERYFRTVRERFLNTRGPGHWKSLEQLNQEYERWQETDYLHKEHSALGSSPLEVFLSQTDSIRVITDPTKAEEYFLLRVTRKVGPDATIRLENRYYETDPKLAGLQVEVRYEPHWLDLAHYPLPLYSNDTKVGQALLVQFQDNAHRKRAGRPPSRESPAEVPKTSARPTVSFAKMAKGGSQ